ncbi:MAG: hypothetical protein U1C46_01275 [Bacteroidales bacterium]|nr:hypothetical protein [Bacteroidales bacterium]
MSFFKKLFGGESENRSKPTVQHNQQDKTKVVEQPKSNRTIFDFFLIDLKSIPDDSFVAAGIETNVSGEQFQRFRKKLDYKECGIFDTVEVIVIGEKKNKNIIFTSFEPSRMKMDYMKKLIDDLYLIHGKDSMKKGKFTNKDIEDFRSKDYYMLFGRDWTGYPKHKFPVSIGRDKFEVSITIWGIGSEE